MKFLIFFKDIIQNIWELSPLSRFYVIAMYLFLFNLITYTCWIMNVLKGNAEINRVLHLFKISK